MPGALDYLDQQIDAIRKQTPAALEAFDEKAVHQARVGTRRLKAGLELLRPVLDKHVRPLARTGRKLRRRLGPLRDLDVMIGRVGETPSNPRLAPALEWLSKELEKARRDARIDDQESGRSAYKLLAKFDGWPSARQAIEAAHDAVEPLIVQALHAQFTAFAEEADWVSKIKEPPPHHGPINVHAVRINGKALRYTFEIAQAHGLDISGTLFKTFKAMQESLGDWHDFVVLAEQTMRHVLDHELPLHDPELAAGVLDLTKIYLKQSNTALDRFRTQWKRGGAELAAALSESVPLLTPGEAAEGDDIDDEDAEDRGEASENGNAPDDADREGAGDAETPASAASPGAEASGPVEQGTISTGATSGNV